MRGMDLAYNDGFVEFFAPRDGMSVTPYLGPRWILVAVAPDWWRDFGKAWSNGSSPGSNYFHLLGTSKDQDDDNVTFWGFSDSDEDYIYVFRESCEATGRVESKTADQVQSFTRDTTIHELAHQWDLNCCAADAHDSRDAWCSTEIPCLGEGCVMHSGHHDFNWDDVVRFCTEDLFGTDPECEFNPPTGCYDLANIPPGWTSEETALRTAMDPR